MSELRAEEHAVVETATTSKPRWNLPASAGRQLIVHREVGPAIALIVLAIFFQVQSDGKFFTPGLLSSWAALSASVGLVSLGVTVLMISGEFDLSVSGTFALGPAIMGMMLRDQELPVLPALGIALVVVSFIGLANGIITTIFAVPSFIVTLGMLFVVTSWNRIILGGFPVQLSDEVGVLKAILGGDVAGIPVAAPFVWMVALAIVLTIVMRRTQFGNWTHAAGSYGGGVARAMGVPVRRVKLTNFVLTALLAGFAGILQFADFGSSSVASGIDLNLLAIVAAVVGGSSLFGTRGTVIGSLLGALIMGALKTGLILIGTRSEYYLALIGTLLVVSAALNARVEVMRRGGQRSSMFG